MSWTEPRVATLKKMWADGCSASDIAFALRGITRNAVIGKVHRLGLSGRAKSSSATAPRAPRPPRSPRAAPAPRVARLTNHGNRFDRVEVRAPAALPPEPMAAPLGQRCTLLELTDLRCKWPIGDPAKPNFFFCGGKAAEELPYCAYHARFAYEGRPRDRHRSVS